MVRPVAAIGGELDGAGAEGRAFCVAVEDGRDEMREPELRLLDSRGDGVVGAGGGELRVRGFQVGDAAFESLVAGINRHQKS